MNRWHATIPRYSILVTKARECISLAICLYSLQSHLCQKHSNVDAVKKKGTSPYLCNRDGQQCYLH